MSEICPMCDGWGTVDRTRSPEPVVVDTGVNQWVVSTRLGRSGWMVLSESPRRIAVISKVSANDAMAMFRRSAEMWDGIEPPKADSTEGSE